jgi:hypothetical protein
MVVKFAQSSVYYPPMDTAIVIPTQSCILGCDLATQPCRQSNGCHSPVVHDASALPCLENRRWGQRLLRRWSGLKP